MAQNQGCPLSSQYPLRWGRAYRWRSASSRDRCRSPREVVRPKVNSDGRQAQRYANPEDRRMMDWSSVARIGLHSITSSARESRARAMSIPMAFAVLRLKTNSYLVGCRTGNTDNAPRKSAVLGQFDCGRIRE
jgi:hypothetical protein